MSISGNSGFNVENQELRNKHLTSIETVTGAKKESKLSQLSGYFKNRWNWC